MNSVVFEQVQPVSFLLRPLLCHHLLPVSSHGLPSMHVCVLIYSSYKDTSCIGVGPTHTASFYLNYPFKGAISKYVPLRCGSEDLSMWNLEEHNSAHNWKQLRILPPTHIFCLEVQGQCWLLWKLLERHCHILVWGFKSFWRDLQNVKHSLEYEVLFWTFLIS